MQDDGFNVLTRVGPGTLMGNLFRRFWLPALLSSELPEPDGTPIRLRILSEDLVAFRDSDGKVGIVGAYCPHKLAPLFFGRNEQCGIRCVYHGWKFNVDGECVDIPNIIPPDNFPALKEKARITSYPGARGRWHRMGLYGTARAHARVARDGMANTAAKSPSCLKMVSPQQLAAGCRR